MISKTELRKWLATLPMGSQVAIDEEGLSLVELTPNGQLGAYYEIGGIPDNDPMWDEANQTRKES